MIKDPSNQMTIGKQISIYALSIFLPPLGLIPGIKYLLQKDQKTKTVGVIAIMLTIISIIVTIWISVGFISQVTTQLQRYQDLGY